MRGQYELDRQVEQRTEPSDDIVARHVLATAEPDVEARLTPLEARGWEGFVNSAGNPLIPTVAEAMEQALTPDEQVRFTAHLRPLVEAGHGVGRMATAYLYAAKP